MTERVLDYFELLGVDRTASPDEIKRAWARQVRIHTPDKDPKRNHELNQAKATLLDPKARKAYEATLDYGEEIEDLLAEAEAAIKAEEWDDAVGPLKEVLALYPDDDATRFKLAVVLYRADRERESADVLWGLVRREPNSSLYYHWLGIVLAELGDTTVAEWAHREACKFSQGDSEPFIALARFLAKKGRFAEAEQAVEEAVHADGKVDVSDLEALLELPLIHLVAKKYGMIERDAQRVRQLLAGADPGLLEFAAFRFMDIADKLLQADRYTEAVLFLDAATQLAPIPEDLRGWERRVRLLAQIVQELGRLKDDYLVLRGLKGVVHYYAIGFAGWKVDFDVKDYFLECLKGLYTCNQYTVLCDVERLAAEYPGLYSLASETLGEIAKVAWAHVQRNPYLALASGRRRTVSAPSPATQAASQPQHASATKGQPTQAAPAASQPTQATSAASKTQASPATSSQPQPAVPRPPEPKRAEEVFPPGCSLALVFFLLIAVLIVVSQI